MCDRHIILIFILMKGFDKFISVLELNDFKNAQNR